MCDLAFFNGSFISTDKLSINASDLSIQRGYGMFDYFVAEKDKIVWFDGYLDRFYGAAEKAKLSVNYERGELKEIIYELLKRNNKHKSGIKIILTGGYSNDGLSPSGKSNLLIFNPDFPELDPDIRKNGANLIMDEYLRPNPGIKTINYFNSILCFEKMKEYNAIDVLYYFDGIVYETSRANVFIIKDGRVITKGTSVLEGLTRKNVMRVIQRHYPLELRDYTTSELFDADEVFITSSAMGICPVVRIENHIVNEASIGDISRKLVRLYNDEVERELVKLLSI